MGELKRKIDEGERTATTLVARKNAAAAQRKVAEAMAGVGSADNAFAALNRFEETVSKEEATAKAFDELASTGKDDDLEKQFAALGGHSVDAELEALKRERQAKPPAAAALYSQGAAGASAAISTGRAGGRKGQSLSRRRLMITYTIEALLGVLLLVVLMNFSKSTRPLPPRSRWKTWRI